MTTFHATMEVAAPAAVVWAVVTDWEAQREWIPGTSVHVVHGDGGSVGSRLVAFTGIADVGFLDTFEIVEWQPPRRCRVRHTGRLLRGDGIFEVKPLGDRATFHWSERLEPPFWLLGRIGMPLVRPLVEAGLRRACRNLAARCVAAAE
jgi:carbon monoxide dehydrogenase subunit G